MVSTGFTDLVGCDLPLQLAGMGGIGSDIALPAAVSRAGGLGMLGAAGMAPAALSEALHALSDVANGPAGVNFLMPFLDPRAVEVASKQCRVVEFFYGEPDRSLVDVVHAGGALAAWQVGSASEASAAVAAGCDFIVVQGIHAGGHVRGTEALAALLGVIVPAVDVPVVAAGGIGTAGDVRASLELGAAAVRVGTRFVAAEESIAHPDYVDALIGATGADSVLTDVFSLGWPDAPHRVLRGCLDAALATDDEFVAVAGGSSQIPRLATIPPMIGASGNVAAMAMYAGTSVGGVQTRLPARAIVAELVDGL